MPTTTGNPRCGICRNPSTQQDLQCSNCINFELLPLKIQYIECLADVDVAKKTINEILKPERKTLMRKFVRNELKLEEVNDVVVTNGNGNGNGKETNGNHNSEVQMSVVLNSRLLTVDLILIRHRINKLRKIMDFKERSLKEGQERLQSLKESIESKKSSIDSRRKALQSNKKSENEKSINESKQENSGLVKQINISKSLLYQELIQLYIVKKRKNGNSNSSNNKNIYTISFTPIISIFNSLELNKETIDTSLQKCIKFITSVSKILLLLPPYELPIKYQYVSNHIFDLDTNELDQFTLLMAKLIHNTVFILHHLQLIPSISLPLTQLFKYDELLYTLCNNDHPLNTEVQQGQEYMDLDTFNQKIHTYLTLKRRGKRNEWNVVDSV